MGVLDRFLNVMKLSPEEEEIEAAQDYLDEPEDMDDEPQVSRRFLRRKEEEDYEDPDLDDDDDEPVRPYSSRRSSESRFSSRSRSSSKVSPIRSSKRNQASLEQGMAVCVIKPHTMEDCRDITDALLANSAVVLNLEGLELELAQRVVDYTCGTCWAIDGNLQQVSSSIIMVTPSSVEISGNFTELLTGALDIPFDRT